MKSWHGYLHGPAWSSMVLHGSAEHKGNMRRIQIPEVIVKGWTFLELLQCHCVVFNCFKGVVSSTMDEENIIPCFYLEHPLCDPQLQLCINGKQKGCKHNAQIGVFVINSHPAI